MSSSQPRYPFVLSFHILKLQLVDRAPGDEGWERGFKQNWSAPANRVSCRLVQTVPTIESPTIVEARNQAFAANNNSSNAYSGTGSDNGSDHSAFIAASSPSVREKSVRTTTQVLASTPPLIIESKTLCAVIGGIGGTSALKKAPFGDQQIGDGHSSSAFPADTTSLLVVPGIESILSTSPVLLMEVCRHTLKQPNVIECRTTFNLVAMSGSLGATDSGANRNVTAPSSPVSLNSSLSSFSDSRLSSFIVEHALLHPVGPLSDSSIFVVATVALTKQSLVARIERRFVHQDSIVNNNNNNMNMNNNSNNSSSHTHLNTNQADNVEANDDVERNQEGGGGQEGEGEGQAQESVVYVNPPLLSAVPNPPPGTLERLCGSVRLSTTDLVVPSLLFTFPDPSAHLVSNVLVVGNATEANQLLIKIQSSCPLVKSFPSAGTVIGPRQRAFFSVTFAGVFASASNAGGAASASGSVPGCSSPPFPHAGGITLVKSSQILQQLSHAKVEVTVQDVNTGEAHHAVPLRLHLRKSDQGQPFSCSPNAGGNNPYHFWINSVCLSNRSHDPTRELPYVKSVLPVFLMRTPKEDVMAMAKDAINASAAAATKATMNQPTLSNVDSFHIDQYLVSNNNNSNNSCGDAATSTAKRSTTTARGNYFQDSSLHNVDLSTNCESFVISVNIGVLRGLLSSNASTVGLHCPTYKIVACPLPEITSEISDEDDDDDDVDITADDDDDEGDDDKKKGTGGEEDFDDADQQEKQKQNQKQVQVQEQEQGFLEFLRFETGEVFPSTAGSLRWDMPLVFRRRKTKKSNIVTVTSKKENKFDGHAHVDGDEDHDKATAVSRNILVTAARKTTKSARSIKTKKQQNIPWQVCRIGLRLVEVPPTCHQQDGGATSSSASSSSSLGGGGGQQPSSSSSSQGNVIAEATLTISPPAPLTSVPTILSQPLAFVVRPCYPQYDALRSTSWLVKGTVIALAGNV